MRLFKDSFEQETARARERERTRAAADMRSRGGGGARRPPVGAVGARARTRGRDAYARDGARAAPRERPKAGLSRDGRARWPGPRAARRETRAAPATCRGVPSSHSSTPVVLARIPLEKRAPTAPSPEAPRAGRMAPAAGYYLTVIRPGHYSVMSAKKLDPFARGLARTVPSGMVAFWDSWAQKVQSPPAAMKASRPASASRRSTRRSRTASVGRATKDLDQLLWMLQDEDVRNHLQAGEQAHRLCSRARKLLGYTRGLDAGGVRHVRARVQQTTMMIP